MLCMVFLDFFADGWFSYFCAVFVCFDSIGFSNAHAPKWITVSSSTINSWSIGMFLILFCITQWQLGRTLWRTPFTFCFSIQHSCIKLVTESPKYTKAFNLNSKTELLISESHFKLCLYPNLLCGWGGGCDAPSKDQLKNSS